MTKNSFNNGLLKFLNQSVTPFHAVETMKARLTRAGYSELKEKDAWKLKPNTGYFVTRNDSSIIAFIYDKDVIDKGLHIVGAHTDSPCLKIKPNPVIYRHGYIQLGVEVYGGALLNPWFDRDLSIAGRISYENKKGVVQQALVDFSDPVVVIPSLAIHLDREANEKRCINKQKDLPPILLQSDNEIDFSSLLIKQIKNDIKKASVAKILDFELFLYDTQPASIIGLENNFIASARLDNLLSCYTGLTSLIDAKSRNSMIVFNDHEEIGSMSSCGAQGTFLKDVMQRIAGSHENYCRMINQSMLISADNAHALHPNFADSHDQNHGPKMNAGPVIKINANQRYATNSETAGIFRKLCDQAKVPVQSFVVRTDMACGSTIGPITASETGVQTIDIGIPQLAMHSVRELTGTDDAWLLHQVMKLFFQQK